MENIANLTPFEKINIVRNVTGITVVQKCVLLVLVTHIGDNEWCFPSFTTLQRETCLTRANLNINLKCLIDMGHLIKISPSDGYKSNRYAIDFGKCLSVDNPKALVSHRYQTSIAPILDQYRTDTRLVSEKYPKEQLNKKEKKNKQQRVVVGFSVHKKKDLVQEHEHIELKDTPESRKLEEWMMETFGGIYDDEPRPTRKRKAKPTNGKSRRA